MAIKNKDKYDLTKLGYNIIDKDNGNIKFMIFYKADYIYTIWTKKGNLCHDFTKWLEEETEE